jgi:hypothetical protein
MSNNASAVKTYNAASSMERLKTKIFSYTYICKNGRAYYSAGVVVVNSKVVGSTPDRKGTLPTRVTELEARSDSCCLCSK